MPPEILRWSNTQSRGPRFQDAAVLSRGILDCVDKDEKERKKMLKLIKENKDKIIEIEI
jgi:hypothetical protein